MSLPELPTPNPDLTQEQALAMILSSIAMEEVALSHILNAEGEKIQHILKHMPCGQCPADVQDILAVNKSVTSLLEMILQNQMILKGKMERVLEHLPRPPRPPEPPCAPKPPCDRHGCGREAPHCRCQTPAPDPCACAHPCSPDLRFRTAPCVRCDCTSIAHVRSCPPSGRVSIRPGCLPERRMPASGWVARTKWGCRPRGGCC
ncbi:MAG: hypothetical protein GX558_11560 [Clostridiales bacterium]|nr:hypothetical protein [Clostridiales bacterium]